MFRIRKSNLKFRALRYEVEPQHDLENRMQQYAQEMVAQDTKLMFTYSHKSPVETHANDEPLEEPQAEEQDAIAVYEKHKDTDFVALLKAFNTTDTELNDREQAEFDELVYSLQTIKKSLKTIRAEIVRRAQVLFCTQQLADSNLVRHNFAEGDESDAVLNADEDGQALEPFSWIQVILPRCAKRVKAVLRFDDRLQVPPLSLSNNIPCNEFSFQIILSFLDCHIRSHPPAVALDVQYWMQRVERACTLFDNLYLHDLNIVLFNYSPSFPQVDQLQMAERPLSGNPDICLGIYDDDHESVCASLSQFLPYFKRIEAL